MANDKPTAQERGKARLHDKKELTATNHKKKALTARNRKKHSLQPEHGKPEHRLRHKKRHKLKRGLRRLTDAPNQPPTLADLPDRDAHPGILLTFGCTANDPDGQALTFTLEDKPATADIDHTTGVIRWTPEWTDLGPKNFLVKVSDGTLFDMKACTVNVINQGPLLAELDDLEGHPGSLLTFAATAWDPDGDNLVFTISDDSKGDMTTAGVFTWTPTWDDLGSHTITVHVRDGTATIHLTDTKSFTVLVRNSAPILNEMPDRDVHPGSTLSFTANAFDPDGGSDPLKFELTTDLTADPRPTIEEATGAITWRPSFAQVGSHTFSVKVYNPKDPDQFDTKACIVNVTNQAPVLDDIADRDDGKVGRNLQFTVSGFDPDNDALQFFVASQPTGFTATIDQNTGIFNWTPAAGQTGTFTFAIRVQDPAGRYDVKTFAITVKP